MGLFFPRTNVTGVHLTQPPNNLSLDELHHFNASQTYIDHVHKEHRKAPRAPAPNTQEEGPGPSLQSTTIDSSCSSNKDASTFQASFQGPFQQTISRASQGTVAAFLTCCLVSST